ncbi:hypothetical protein [Streptomyces sp. TSRI0281]|uniref:hypothetical protein n=1 Tax=Streptomyces sp. TSRI0281 TaxID=1718998 RepID=UPI001F521146|nr:hypothetical protein [Streptomyces sp. TSRI0281]
MPRHRGAKTQHPLTARVGQPGSRAGGGVASWSNSLVHVAETRQVRGGTEQYYRRTARHMVVAEPQAAGTTAMLAAVAQELDRSPAETHLTLRHLRLEPAKARELSEALTKLVDESPLVAWSP